MPTVQTRLRAVFWVIVATVAAVTSVRAGQLPPPPPPPPPPPGALSTPASAPEIRKGAGFVLGQVVDAGSGQPVAGAIVTITGFGALPGGVPGGAQAVAPITSAALPPSAPRLILTDRQGRFFFRELPGGRFGIAVSAPGFLQGGYLQKKPGGTPHFLDLAHDEKRGDIQIQLWKFGSIMGTVLDEAGEPAVGVVVRAMRRGMSGGKMRLTSAGSATTDDRGVYRLATLMPGSYVAAIMATQSTMAVSTSEAFSDASVAGMASPVVVSLQSSGVSVGTGGTRIGDQILQYMPARSGYVLPQPGADGSILSYVTTFYPGAPASADATVITIGSGDERTGVDFALKPVRTSRVSGTLIDPTGSAGQLGLRLVPTWIDDASAESGLEVAVTSTDAAGAFTFLGVPAGSYVLKVMKAPGASPFLEFAASEAFVTAFRAEVDRGRVATGAASPGQSFWASQPVTVGAADVTGLAVTLREGLRVSGRVEFVGTKSPPTPQQLGAASITLSPLGARPTVPMAPGRVGANLQFASAGFPAGKYFVSANVPAAGWTLLSIVAGNRDVTDEPLELEGDTTSLVVTFTDTPTELSGTIVDAKNAPYATAEVIVFPADSDSWRQGAFGTRRIRLTPGTKSGTYAIPGLPPGQYFVAAADEGATAEWQDPRFLERLQRSATRVTLKPGEKLVQALTLALLR